MSTAALQPGLPAAAMPVPPSWTRPPAEQTEPAQETQRDRDRQSSGRDTVSRAREDGDSVSLSPEAERLVGDGGASEDDSGKSTSTTTLSAEEQAYVRDLKARDSEVRRHERAHQTVGGHLAGAASYETVQGPDGRAYAVGGEVPIDASPEDDPQATIDKMERVKAAALAPAEPSAQDRAVAAMAEVQKAAAAAELRDLERAEAAATKGEGEGEGEGEDGAVGAETQGLDSVTVSGGVTGIFGPTRLRTVEEGLFDSATRAYDTAAAYGTMSERDTPRQNLVA